MRLTATIDLSLPPGGAAPPGGLPPDPAVVAGELYEALRALGATSVAVAVQEVEEPGAEARFDEEGGECAPADERGGRSRGEYEFGEDLGDDL